MAIISELVLRNEIGWWHLCLSLGMIGLVDVDEFSGKLQMAPPPFGSFLKIHPNLLTRSSLRHKRQCAEEWARVEGQSCGGNAVHLLEISDGLLSIREVLFLRSNRRVSSSPEIFRIFKTVLRTFLPQKSQGCRYDLRPHRNLKGSLPNFKANVVDPVQNSCPRYLDVHVF